MYLHLGQDYVINDKKIIGIFDIETTSISKITKQFLSDSQKRSEIVTISDDIPKSYVVCKDSSGTIVYISQISTATLKKRLEHFEIN